MRRRVNVPMRRLGEVNVASSNVKKAVAGSSADASRCSKIIHSFKASNREEFNFIFLILKKDTGWCH